MVLVRGVTDSTARTVFDCSNVRWFILFRILFNARFYYPVFMILFLDFGLTLEQFAIMNAVWAAAIVTLEVPSGALADIVGRRNLVVVAAALMVVEMAILCFVPLQWEWLIVAAFALNRLLSGAAEAAASGADEALAYDSVSLEGDPDDWPKVLERMNRWLSIAFVGALLVGSLVFDPSLVNRVLGGVGFDLVLTKETTMRFPLYLTLLTAVGALYCALRMREVEPPDDEDEPREDDAQSVAGAFRQTWRAARWVWATPFALVVILGGLVYDSVSRMMMTLNSEYFRMIGYPEWSFGVVGIAMAAIGIFTPRLARYLAENREPLTNALVIVAITTTGLIGCSFLWRYGGVVYMGVLQVAFGFTSFFLSHYLNRLASSRIRATVLSFRGLALNVGYGVTGLLYSGLIAIIKGGELGHQLDGDALQRAAFAEALAWFAPFFLVLVAVHFLFSWWRLGGREPATVSG